MPPEVRVTMDNFRGVRMEFTQTMRVPNSVSDEMNADASEQDGTEAGARRRLDNTGGVSRRMDVVGIKGDEPDEDDYGYNVIDGWEEPSINEDGISMKLKISDPLHVSIGDEPDFVLVQLELDDMVSENGVPMQASMVKKIMVTQQMES